MEIDLAEEKQGEDPFLKFIEDAKSVLSPDYDIEEGEEQLNVPGWSWIVSRILKTCIAYSSGVTAAILLSDLSQAWSEQNRSGAQKKRPECINQLAKMHKRVKLPTTVTIDSIYDKNFLSLSSVIEAVVVDAFVLPGTNIHVLTLGDFWSSNTIDLYLHRRYYSLADPNCGILKKGREIFLTGCYLRTSTAGSAQSRLLPTEYIVTLLNEDLDDDAMLIGAQFCSDSFSSISPDAFNKGVSYSFYARIESIGSLEIQDSIQRKQITLVDDDGVRLTFSLWGDQVLLANCFSVGSMLALDRPFIASLEPFNEISLEYGSETQLYTVPLLHHEEQVSVALTQNRYPGSKLLKAFEASQGPQVSQVTLPCNSLGSIDFSNYPFRPLVTDLRDKMTGIGLYGTITDIKREQNSSRTIFSMRVKETTGSIWAKLHFVNSWSSGRLALGHTVYISGLTCTKTKYNRLEVLWFEDAAGSLLVNLSCLPALLTSYCLQKLSSLSELSDAMCSTYICQIWLDQIPFVTTRYSHILCGHYVNKTSSGAYECNFCCRSCDSEVVRTFHLKVTLADESAKISAWCTGHAATELLQISPDEFDELPEEEQYMYPTSIQHEHERFTVAIVNCKRQSNGSADALAHETDSMNWEVTRALKCE
ncbi:Nucleic acid-binding, OB-fold [Heracleum sosnowskyi]|uniref:Nucleic acid-binding, OB-fold n=1 Tax=Heracleum sosnowskyi TaxID=360622 RepID=A0AAD8MVS0_9APIA|nr:Nucleic acid-binding, OB-fold [Heracleum sosnowskyi]